MTLRNIPVPDAYEYFPLNKPEIGAVLDPQAENIPLLFKPLVLKDVVFKNRIFAVMLGQSPMCQYSSDNGHATDWHLVNIGGFATRGVGAICMEATAVLPEGRVSPEDAGLWTDTQIEPLRRIVDFSHAHATKLGIQLAHAGRKASIHAPWVLTQARGEHGLSHVALEDEGGWPSDVYGPSNISFSTAYPDPKTMTEKDLLDVENAFIASIERCKKAGFDFVELHGAHGYLLHNFLSPLSNTRTDEYGGQPLENRLRFVLRLVERCRKSWPDKPLFVRISATDWAEGPEKDDQGAWRQWGIEQSTILVEELRKIGVDLIDCSSGGNWAQQKVILKPGYQVQFAEALKKSHPDMPVGAVGLITDPLQAESYLKNRQADVIFLARELIRNPHWSLLAAQQLGVKVKPANQYERGWF